MPNETFTTGAQRDQQGDKLRYDLMSPLAAKRIAKVFTDGAKRYGDRNWEKGMPFTRVLASALRHLHAYQLGDKGEDHLAQLAWNVEALLHYEEAIKGGTLPANLNDLPLYGDAHAYLNALVNAASWGVKAASTTCGNTCDAEPIKPLPQNAYMYRGPFAGMRLKVIQRHETWYDVNLSDYTYGQWMYRISEFFADSTPQKEDTVYLAGPMRGLPDFNFPAFDKARDCLTERGWNVISPADMDRADPDDAKDQTKFAARDTKAIIEKCGTIALLPGWECSDGATAEFFLARWLGLKIISIWTDDDGAMEMRISDPDERAAAYRIIGR